MTKNTINCAECKSEYTYDVPIGYPDRRKYCPICSAKKKAEWDNAPEDKAPVGYATSDIKKGESTTDKIALERPTKEFHLSPEEVKCRALESAIEFLHGRNIDGENVVIQHADKFVEWIYNGN